jgi:crotonobetainyl-CoA:carnitine CoA-transferase CaiB-like acyl-CoA transferase
MLEGLRVVEYATYVAAPGAACIMADWGAAVIKVEPPGGDPLRMFMATAGADTAANPVFDMDNRGKRGIVLDSTKPEGLEALLRLVDRADVFITNVRPGGLARAHLDPETLLKRCPSLIYASLTGYGLLGPDADRPGMDAAAFWARSGLAALFSPKGGEPIPLRTAFGDHVTSMAIVSGVLAALYERNATGRGRLVETSLLRSAHYAASSDLAIQHAFGRVASTKSRREAAQPLMNFFKTSEARWISLLMRQGERDWARLARALGLTGVAGDPRFKTARDRRTHREALLEILDAAFAALTFSEVAAALDKEELVWAPVLSPRETTVDVQAVAAGCVVQIPHSDGLTISSVASPVRFPGAEDGPRGGAPRLGEHTRTVLAELGYTEDEVTRMFDVGAAA